MRLLDKIQIAKTPTLESPLGVLAEYDLRVRFNYTRKDKKDKAPRETTAVIELDGLGESMVFTGFSRRHPKDNHCRQIARKYALTDALKTIPDSNIRRRIWEAWLNRPNSKGESVHRP